MTSNLYLSELYVYPIKSLGGVRLDSATVEARGLQHDRRWMLVDAHNQFLTQRKYGQMALLKTTLEGMGLRITAPGKGELRVPYGAHTGEKLNVTVWDDTCPALAVGTRPTAGLRRPLGFPAGWCTCPPKPPARGRPVRPFGRRRELSPTRTRSWSLASFPGRPQRPADRARAHQPLPAQLRGARAAPFAEDTWGHFRIGESYFYGVKPCARCVMTTIDQETAQKGREPLQTLATYRAANNKIYFGQNTLYANQGTRVAVGDPVEVLRLGKVVSGEY
jgi:uncharacterized protein YcbX